MNTKSYHVLGAIARVVVEADDVVHPDAEVVHLEDEPAGAPAEVRPRRLGHAGLGADLGPAQQQSDLGTVHVAGHGPHLVDETRTTEGSAHKRHKRQSEERVHEARQPPVAHRRRTVRASVQAHTAQ